MAEKIYPVASSNHIYYTSDIQNLNKALIKDKTLILSTSLKVTAKTSPNMTVSVSSGSAFNNGMFYQNSATVSLTIDSNTGSLPRKDAICIEFNGANSKLVVIKGNPATSPVISSTATDSNHILLAEVLVGVGATSIQASNITDSRKTDQHVITSLAGELFAAEDRIKALENYPRITKYKYGANPSYEVWSTGKNKIWGQGIINQASGNFDHTTNFYNDCGLYFKNPGSCIIQVMYNSDNANNVRVVTARLASNGKSLRITIPGVGAYTGVYRWCVEGV